MTKQMKDAYETLSEEDKLEFWGYLDNILSRRGGNCDIRRIAMDNFAVELGKFLWDKAKLDVWVLT